MAFYCRGCANMDVRRKEIRRRYHGSMNSASNILAQD